LLDTRWNFELDALRPETERQGDALRRKEQMLTKEVERLRAGVESAPSPVKPAFNNEIGTTR
jgi:hypothetical protein